MSRQSPLSTADGLLREMHSTMQPKVANSETAHSLKRNISTELTANNKNDSSRKKQRRCGISTAMETSPSPQMASPVLTGFSSRSSSRRTFRGVTRKLQTEAFMESRPNSKEEPAMDSMAIIEGISAAGLDSPKPVGVSSTLWPVVGRVFEPFDCKLQAGSWKATVVTDTFHKSISFVAKKYRSRFILFRPFGESSLPAPFHLRPLQGTDENSSLVIRIVDPALSRSGNLAHQGFSSSSESGSESLDLSRSVLAASKPANASLQPLSLQSFETKHMDQFQESSISGVTTMFSSGFDGRYHLVVATDQQKNEIVAYDVVFSAVDRDCAGEEPTMGKMEALISNQTKSNTDSSQPWFLKYISADSTDKGSPTMAKLVLPTETPTATDPRIARKTNTANSHSVGMENFPASQNEMHSSSRQCSQLAPQMELTNGITRDILVKAGNTHTSGSAVEATENRGNCGSSNTHGQAGASSESTVSESPFPEISSTLGPLGSTEKSAASTVQRTLSSQSCSRQEAKNVRLRGQDVCKQHQVGGTAHTKSGKVAKICDGDYGRDASSNDSFKSTDPFEVKTRLDGDESKSTQNTYEVQQEFLPEQNLVGQSTRACPLDNGESDSVPHLGPNSAGLHVASTAVDYSNVMKVVALVVAAILVIADGMQKLLKQQ